MGVKLSKLMKRSYVVSEGVQTDLSIQCFDDIDTRLFETPPRDIQYLCDPRSVTRGIVRTPIICSIHENVLNDSEKKPYLETNLDEVLPYEDVDTKQEHDIPISVSSLSSPSNSVLDTKTPNSSLLSEELHKSQSCKIEIESIEVEEKCLIIHNGNLNNYRSSFNQSIKEEINDSLNINIEKNYKCPVRIDSSETVEQVCQQILDELESESKLNESSEEIFVDGNISDIVESMRKLCIDRSGASINRLQSNRVCSDENDTPVTSRYQSKKYRKDFEKITQPYDFKSPNKLIQRKPLGEVNKNVQMKPHFGSPMMKSHQDTENSPLKSLLPLLPSQPPLSAHTKSHRSKWDTENTLII